MWKFGTFQPNFTEIMCMYSGRYRLLFFLAICQTLKVYGILKISYLSYIALMHKVMLVLSGKRSNRASRPMSFLLNSNSNSGSIKKLNSNSGHMPPRTHAGTLATVDWLHLLRHFHYFTVLVFDLYFKHTEDLQLSSVAKIHILLCLEDG